MSVPRECVPQLQLTFASDSSDPPPARAPIPAPLPSETNGNSTIQVVAAFDFGGAEPGDLPFRRGDVIEVLKRTASTEDWWFGSCRGRTGNFPANYTDPLD